MHRRTHASARREVEMRRLKVVGRQLNYFLDLQYAAASHCTAKLPSRSDICAPHRHLLPAGTPLFLSPQNAGDMFFGILNFFHPHPLSLKNLIEKSPPRHVRSAVRCELLIVRSTKRNKKACGATTAKQTKQHSKGC